MKHDVSDLKPCPFCGGNSKVSIRDMIFYGQDIIGNKKIKYGAQVICNRCHARGGIATAIIITDRADTRVEMDKLRERAIELWNRRSGEAWID